MTAEPLYNLHLSQQKLKVIPFLPMNIQLLEPRTRRLSQLFPLSQHSKVNLMYCTVLLFLSFLLSYRGLNVTSMTFRQITNSAFPLSNQTEKLSSCSRILAEGTAFRLSKREESRGGKGQDRSEILLTSGKEDFAINDDSIMSQLKDFVFFN